MEEHEADKNKMSEDSHHIKHLLTEYQDLLATTKFRFSLIQSFKDPLSRQLAESVRIELRGENILNPKSECSRCRVPRLRVDLEGWTSRKKVQEASEKTVSSLEEAKERNEDEELCKEAEESLEERDYKRKNENPADNRRMKKRKLERLVGWGENSSLLEQEERPIEREDGELAKSGGPRNKLILMSGQVARHQKQKWFLKVGKVKPAASPKL